MGLFSDSPDKILGMNIANFWDWFRAFRTGLRFDFNPGTNVFGFCGVFWYHNNSVTNREGAKKCHILYGSEIWDILCVIVEKNK